MSAEHMHPADPTADTMVIDIRERLAERGLAEDARAAGQATEAGIADVSTGTIRLRRETTPGAVEAVPPAFRRGAARHAGAAARLIALGAGTTIRTAWDYQTGGQWNARIREARARIRATSDPAERDQLRAQIEAWRAERHLVVKGRHRAPGTIAGAAGAGVYTAALLGIATLWGAAAAAPVLLPLVAAMYIVGRREQAARELTGAPVVPGVVLERAAADAAELAAVAQPGRPQLLGASDITDAFRSAKVIGPEEEVTLVGLPTPDGKQAVAVTFELPGHLTVEDVVDKAPRIAKAFRVPLTQLDLRQGAHPGECKMWLAQDDPFGDAATSPLLQQPERQDAWGRGVLIGHNRRGEQVRLRLRHVMALLGGMSRTGKGMVLRNVIVGLGLDPRVNLRLVAGAKPGEHAGYAPVCATFFGRDPERLLALLDALLAEAYRREAVLEERRKAKLSERDLGHFPLEVVIIDEFKQYTMRGKPHAEEIVARIEELAAFAAALNITLLLATQDPDANTIPRGYKSNCGARIATRTGGATQTNAILKDGATGAGLRAHDIPESLPGGAIVDIDGAPGELIRSYFIEDDEYDGAEPLITAARKLREEEGRAPGQFDDPIERDLIAATGHSSIGGGALGRGRPTPVDGSVAAVDAGVLPVLLGAFPAGADRIPMDAVRQALASWRADEWGRHEGEPKEAYESRVGQALVQALKRELAGTGAALESTRWREGDDRVRGFLREHVEAAAQAARNVTK